MCMGVSPPPYFGAGGLVPARSLHKELRRYFSTEGRKQSECKPNVSQRESSRSPISKDSLASNSFGPPRPLPSPPLPAQLASPPHTHTHPPPPQEMGPNVSLFSRFLQPGETRIHLLGVDAPIGSPGPSATVQGWRREGKWRAAAMDADSGRVCPRRKRFPTSGRGSAAALLEPTRRGAGTVLSGAGAARGPGRPRPSTAPRGPGMQRGDARGGAGAGKKSGCRTKRETSLRPASPWRPALPGIPPTPETPRSRKFRKRNCKQVSRSLRTGSQASRRRLQTLHITNAVKDKPPRESGDRSARHPARPRGTSPGFLHVRVPSPGPLGRPNSPFPGSGGGAVVGGAPAASGFLPPPAPPHKNGKLGPCENRVECSL